MFNFIGNFHPKIGFFLDLVLISTVSTIKEDLKNI